MSNEGDEVELPPGFMEAVDRLVMYLDLSDCCKTIGLFPGPEKPEDRRYREKLWAEVRSFAAPEDEDKVEEMIRLFRAERLK